MSERASRDAYDAAQEALARVGHASHQEQALIPRVATRYEWLAPQDRRRLDERYAAAMGDAYRMFPDDPDIGGCTPRA